MAVWELTLRIFTILLLEAKDQAGGRAWSVPFSFSNAVDTNMGVENKMVDRGRAFIHDGSPDNSAVWLTTQFEIETRDVPGSDSAMVGDDTAVWVRSDDGSNIATRDVNKGRELLDRWFDEATAFVRARIKEDGYSRGISVSDINDDILSKMKIGTDTDPVNASENQTSSSSCSRCDDNNGYGSHTENSGSSSTSSFSLSPSSLLAQLPPHM